MELNEYLVRRRISPLDIGIHKKQVEDKKARLTTPIEAQKILQEVAQAVQTKAHKQVARVVSRCLSAVFQRPYELQIKFEKRRGKTEADFVYFRDGHELSPRVTSGGVRQIAGLALRLACLMLTLPPARKFLALDEPFQGLSRTNIPKMGRLLEALSRDLGVQFLLCTHNEELEVGSVVRLSSPGDACRTISPSGGGSPGKDLPSS